ncbi:hypothetical protein HPB47_022186, partial [Ixodes persulcatus]
HEDANDGEESWKTTAAHLWHRPPFQKTNEKKDLLQVPHQMFEGTFSEPSDLESPITLFRKFLANFTLKRLVEHTNLYIAQKYGG